MSFPQKRKGDKSYTLTDHIRGMADDHLYKGPENRMSYDALNEALSSYFLKDSEPLEDLMYAVDSLDSNKRKMKDLFLQATDVDPKLQLLVGAICGASMFEDVSLPNCGHELLHGNRVSSVPRDIEPKEVKELPVEFLDIKSVTDLTLKTRDIEIESYMETLLVNLNVAFLRSGCDDSVLHIDESARDKPDVLDLERKRDLLEPLKDSEGILNEENYEGEHAEIKMMHKLYSLPTVLEMRSYFKQRTEVRWTVKGVRAPACTYIRTYIRDGMVKLYDQFLDGFSGMKSFCKMVKVYENKDHREFWEDPKFTGFKSAITLAKLLYHRITKWQRVNKLI